MAEDRLHSRRLELSSNDLGFDQNIFDEALFKLNKEVESLSGKSIKDLMQSIYEKQTMTIPDFYKSFKMNIA